MSKRSYYGEQFEGMIIAGMSFIIIVSMLGACSLMRTNLHKCQATDYTYCGENETTHH